jgi:hypothetical protein
MTRNTSNNRIEKLITSQTEQVKRNVRFDIQRAFGDEKEIDHLSYTRLLERVHMQMKETDNE